MKRFLRNAYAEVALRVLILMMVLIVLVSGMINPQWTMDNLLKD